MVREARIEAAAFAKVNLHLWVGDKRPDGFHPIVSIFQMVDLHDTIVVSATRGREFSLSLQGLEGVSPEISTLGRAARLYGDYVESTASLEINCIKRIPMQAGLGGGSSDAATVLIILNELHGNPLGASELSSLGATIGSDVPFFLGGGPTALVEGRGEILTVLPSRKDLVGLLVMPPGPGVSTAQAFGALDALRPVASLPPPPKELAAMYAEAVEQWSFSNDFSQVMQEHAPFYDMLGAMVEAEGNSFGTISGSGSCYCIISENKTVLERLRAKIERKWDDIWVSGIKCLHRDHSDVTVLL